MSNRPAPFTQADITRAAKGAAAAGLNVREIIATADGVRIICGDEKARKPSNQWDEVLDEAT